MKLLRVIANMDPATGGPCEGIRNSIKALQKLGVENEVVSLDRQDAAFLKLDSFPIHALGTGKGPWFYNAALVPWLLNNFHRLDAVIVHGLWLYPSHATYKALGAYRRKLAINGDYMKVPKLYVMPHGMLDPYFQKASGRRLKALRNWLYWKLLERRVVNNADASLFTCGEELCLARKTFRPYRPKKEVNVGYGIARPSMQTNSQLKEFFKKCPKVAGKPYFLFLSRVHPKKGLDLLLQAYIPIQQREGYVDIPLLVIAGPGLDSAFGKKMQLLVKKNPLISQKVFFPGMLNGDAKWGAFYGAEAFVLPSHQENFGIAVVEALACQKPVLISNQINIWKEIQEEGGGIVADDTLEGTYKLLNTWLNLSPMQRRELQTAAGKTYEKHFEINGVALKFLNAVSS